MENNVGQNPEKNGQFLNFETNNLPVRTHFSWNFQVPGRKISVKKKIPKYLFSALISLLVLDTNMGREILVFCFSPEFIQIYFILIVNEKEYKSLF